jgi:hypothetical protein
MAVDRYFVTVTAPSPEKLKALSTRGLDLFMPTARKKGTEAVIEGLLTLDEVSDLVKDGYRVSVDATMESRARATETTTLDAWLQAMGE